jgi:hypothetical protein
MTGRYLLTWLRPDGSARVKWEGEEAFEMTAAEVTSYKSLHGATTQLGCQLFDGPPSPRPRCHDRTLREWMSANPVGPR